MTQRYNNQEFAVEAAVAAYLRSITDPALAWFEGRNVNTLALPCGFVQAQLAEEAVHNSATMDCVISVGAYTALSSTGDEHSDLVGEIMDAVFNADFIQGVSAQNLDMIVQRVQRGARRTVRVPDDGLRFTEQLLTIRVSMNKREA